MIQPKRIHEFVTATSGELSTGTPVIEVEVYDGVKWLNRKTDLPGATTPLEERINGTALYNATMTGTVNLDLSTFTAYYGILTGNTDITVTNTPATGFSFVRSLKIESDTTESLTLPVGWEVIGTYEADGSVNDLQIEFSNFPTVGLTVTVYINQWP